MLIGNFKNNDLFIAIILFFVSMFYLFHLYRKNCKRHCLLLIFGFFLSAILGSAAEIWGIYFSHWEYHDLSSDRKFPYWLPFAWGCSFLFLYRFEHRIFSINSNLKCLQKNIISVCLFTVFPTWGEAVTIYFGVWTYNWGYQIIGVPFLAIILLTIFHVSIFLSMSFLYRRFAVSDFVFNCRQPIFGTPSTTNKHV